MRGISAMITIAVVSFLSSAGAQAATVGVSGTLDWTLLTHFNNAHSAEVVFVDITDFENLHFTVVPVTAIANHKGSYSTTLNTSTPYFIVGVIADCASSPESCGTAAATGTHIRFNNFVTVTPDGGPPITLNVTADASVDPVSICGSVSVQSGTFVKLFASNGPGIAETFDATGVFSTARTNAPTVSYCVQGMPSSFNQLDSTITIQQTRVPTCPAQSDVQRNEGLFLGTDPLTHDYAIVVPAAAGRLRGTFSVVGFAHDRTNVFGGNSGPTIGDCAGVNTFSVGGGAGSPVSFDLSPALSGSWFLNASASRRVTSPDGLAQVDQSSIALIGNDYITVNVAPGSNVVAPLTFTRALLAGNFSVDIRRWGAPASRSEMFPTLEAVISNATPVGAGWTPSLRGDPPMRVTERYELNLDPRVSSWMVRTVNPMSYAHSFPVVNGSAGSSFDDLATLPNRMGAPFLQEGNLAVVVGSVTANQMIAMDLPPVDFRIATVTFNPPAGGSSISWSASHGQYTLSNGLLDVGSADSNAFTFDSSPVVGHAKLPPGRYDGTTRSVDSSMNSLAETRRLDLEADDELTVDFGAPMLSAVRPIPGAAGGSVTVTGTVTSGHPTVTPPQVFVNGVAATVASGGKFSRTTTIGTGPLTVVARDSTGKTTTLKRYFTTMTGLLAPAAGADLVSEGQDLNAIQGFFYLPATSTASFHIPQTIALKLTGKLGSAAVTATNAAAAPRVAAMLDGAAGTIVHPTNGETVFHYDTGAAQWICNLGTKSLTPGTYVVQIRFWDGRILEAALVLV